MHGLIKQTKFRNLLCGRIFSVFGDSLVYITLLKWVEIQSGSTEATTLFFISFYLPAALFAIPIGAWIEGKVFQKVMVYSDLIRGSLLLLFIALLPLLHHYQWAYAFLFADSVLSLFFIPANQALLPYIVAKNEQSAANGLLQSAYMVMRIAGHGVAAFFISIGVGTRPLLLLSASLVLLSLTLIQRIRPYTKSPIDKSSEWQIIITGLQYVWNDRHLKSLFTLFVIVWFVGSSIELIFVAYIKESLNLGVEGISYFTITQFIGMMLGAIIITKFYNRFDQKWYIVAPIFSFGFALLSLKFIGGLFSVLPFFLIAGFSFGLFNVAFPTYIQQTANKQYFTRIFSLQTMIFNFMPLPGLLVFGLMISKLGISVSTIIIACLLLTIAAAAIFRFPKLGKLTEEGIKEEVN